MLLKQPPNRGIDQRLQNKKKEVEVSTSLYFGGMDKCARFITIKNKTSDGLGTNQCIIKRGSLAFISPSKWHMMNKQESEIYSE